MEGQPRATVYTIGHSAHSIDAFLALLRGQDIETLIDVRSHPRSRWHPHFNRKRLDASLAGAGIRYLYMGDELGGHPDNKDLYAGDGHLLYDRLSSRAVRSALKRVIEVAMEARTVLMCMEEDPAACHRHPLLARGLLERNVAIWHIRRDGSLDDGAALPQGQPTEQLALIEPAGEDASWKSPTPIKRSSTKAKPAASGDAQLSLDLGLPAKSKGRR